MTKDLQSGISNRKLGNNLYDIMKIREKNDLTNHSAGRYLVQKLCKNDKQFLAIKINVWAQINSGN